MGNQLQHYVPRFMLRRFGKGKKEHVHSICAASAVHSVGLRAFRSWLLTACTSSMLHCASPPNQRPLGLSLIDIDRLFCLC